MDMMAFPMNSAAYGASGALVHMPGFASGANSVLVYFSCADCAVEAARVVTAGGQFGFIALVFDTEGNMVGLHSMQ